MANSFGTGIADVGGAVGDIFGYFGDQSKAETLGLSADEYRDAAALTGQNIELQQQSNGIQQLATSRSIYKNLSTQQATAAANGFQESGSALDILADSKRQGALQQQIVLENGKIKLNTLQSQQDQYETQAEIADKSAQAAKNSGFGDLIGGALKGIAGIAAFAAL